MLVTLFYAERRKPEPQYGVVYAETIEEARRIVIAHVGAGFETGTAGFSDDYIFNRSTGRSARVKGARIFDRDKYQPGDVFKLGGPT